MAQSLLYRDWPGYVGRLVVSDQYPHEPGTLHQRGAGLRATFYLEWPASSGCRWEQQVKPPRDTLTLFDATDVRCVARAPPPCRSARPPRKVIITIIEEDDFESADTVSQCCRRQPWNQS